MKKQSSCYYVFENSEIRHQREEIESTFYKVGITAPKGIRVYKIYEKCEECETPVSYGYYILKSDWYHCMRDGLIYNAVTKTVKEDS